MNTYTFHAFKRGDDSSAIIKVTVKGDNDILARFVPGKHGFPVEKYHLTLVAVEIGEGVEA